MTNRPGSAPLRNARAGRGTRVVPWRLFIVLLYVGADSQFTVAAETESERLDAIREWIVLRGDEEPRARPDVASEDPWLRYLSIGARGDREEALGELLKSDLDARLRHVIIRDLATDLSFQSRRAQFIRRYGFYATWFNRFTFMASRALQGNLQAFGQVVVDSVFDMFWRTRATPAERRHFRLLGRLEAEGRAGDRDLERLRKLERKLARAGAEIDVERASYALEQGHPEAARFYARGALGQWPGHRKAEARLEQAERLIAQRRRGAVASRQVGYPDRSPPFEATSERLLRASVSRDRSDLIEFLETDRGRAPAPAKDVSPVLPPPEDRTPTVFVYPGDEYLAWMLTTLGDSDEGTIMAMRRWAETMRASEELQSSKTAWLAALMLDPEFNPDLKLARAQADRRGRLARFIFVGPDSDRERAYGVASRAAQAWHALAGVGIFYGFEVIYRLAVATLSPPPPAEDVFDAAATFLRAEPLHPESREIARWLAEQYLAAGRYEQARRTLKRYNMLDPKRGKKIDRAEARGLLARADSLAHADPRRALLLSRVLELAPDTGLARRAMKELEREPPEGQELVIEVSWETLRRWFDKPLPAGLPGRPEWFDGAAQNGEADGKGFRLRAESKQAEQVEVSYLVRREGRREIVVEMVELDRPGDPLAAWARLTLAGAAQSDSGLNPRGRSRIPYAFTGGIGLSGVDFYPQLLPIEIESGELKLYQD